MSSSTNRETIIAHGTRSLREALVGAWRLLSCAETDVATGEIFLPMGERPQGLILYTPDGYMSAQLSASDRADFSSGDMYRGTPEDYVRDPSSEPTGSERHIKRLGGDFETGARLADR
jgi:hypothetical protein